MKTILVIEDNVVIRENTTELLELAGYNVIVAENGKEGIILAKEKMPDLVLCDITMPELDGYGVFNALNGESATNKIPFVFITASAEQSEMKKGLAMGAWAYIRKPFEAYELHNTVKDCLDNG